ncbi:phosphomannomutase/phosphoglucomutase [Candidatus Peregrinibacteria bacterium]|nr:phosphomannomutase/phosphoglucomutase [Candidatus Peregrinibacteria bacterium]
MNINPLIFRAYDIRGIAAPRDNKPADLTPETAYLIGRATGIYLKKKYETKTMAVGCDNRLTGESLKKGYMRGLIDSGIRPTDIGLVTSPMVYWTTCAKASGNSALPFDSATNITASHNPKEYNGLKIVTKSAHSICGDELQEILKIIEKNSPSEDTVRARTSEASGSATAERSEPKNQDIWPKYLADILARTKLLQSTISNTSIPSNPPPSTHLKVIVDCGNGVAGKFAPELLRKLGCEVIELFCNLDGNFPNHEANPEELHNMQDLIKKVLENKADLGLGFDGDGDRVGVVDEKGHHYSADFILLLLARDLLTRLPNSQIVFDIKVSQTIINDLKKHGAIPVMSKTGHSFIEAKMKEIGAPLAGEVSGHLFFAENYYGFDDALFAAARILEIASHSQKPFSELFTDLPKTCTTPEFKAHCPDDRKFAIVKELVAHFTKIYDCITIDGVRVNFDENSWGAIRASNTGPNLTLRFEALTPERLQEIQKIMVTELKKYPEISLDWYKE